MKGVHVIHVATRVCAEMGDREMGRWGDGGRVLIPA
jgi:hypothetical protein